MITIPDALEVLRPGAEWVLRGDTYDGIEWLDTIQSKPTLKEVQDEIARLEAQAPLEACKEEAKRRLAATDWSVLADVGLQNQDAFVFYRLNLRNLVRNPVADPVWEVEPQPVWSE